jgi:TonB-linked SusC/RagA family outer membrane protein
MQKKVPKSKFNHKLLIVLSVLFVFSLASTSAFAQINVTGRVTDKLKEPLPGVTINIKGTKFYTSTNNEGYFKVSVPNQQAVLVFSFISFITEERPVGSNKEINVTLNDRPNDLDEVVVVGYGTEKKSDLTGSVSSIKSEQIVQSKTVSFLEAMQGKLAGVQITSASGEPGAGVNISIRGANSINAGTTPLYVIDGVQIDANNGEVGSFSTALNPLSSINPSDIESIEVLKDASATAIFGSRGANGVVLITTKSGKGSSRIEFNSFTGISTANKQLDLVGGQDYATYRFETNRNDPLYGQDTDGNGSLDAVRDYSNQPSINWQNRVLRPALSQNYNISFAEGGPKTDFSTSLGYFSQEGIVLNNSFERYSLNFKINHKPNKNFKIGTTLNGSYVEANGVGGSNGQGLIYNGIVQSLIMYKPINVPDEGLSNVDEDNLVGLSNPLDFVNFSYKKTPLTRLVGNTFAEYKIIPELTLRLSGGAVLTSSDNGEFYPSTTSWGFTSNGRASINNVNTLTWLTSNTLNYTKRFKKIHYLNALVGYDANSYLYKSFVMRAEGFDVQTINGVDNIAQAQVLVQVPTTARLLSTREAFFGRVNYNYKSKYLVTATLRNDGSSKFGRDNKFALFPSGALAWNVSSEKFMKKIPAVSNLKLRTSFGVTGNDRIPAYQSLATANSVNYSGTDNSQLGIAVLTTANPNLKWETTYQYDAGMDLEFLNGKFGVTVDVYRKETRDMLLEADIPGQTGFSKQFQNIGRVDNQGLEFSFNSVNIKSKNFSWTSNFNITFNRNKVVSLGDASSIAVRINDQIQDVGRVVVGQPIGTAYGLVFDGIYQNSDFSDLTNFVLNSGVVRRAGVSVRPGDFKFKDLDGDNIVDNTNDRTIISDSNPQHFGGLTNTFTYKGFDLSTQLYWSYGNEILNLGRYRVEGYQGATISQAYFDNRWSETNPSNAYPRFNANGRFDNSSYYVEDGSFLRLRNVSLGYNIPSSVVKNLKINSCRVYLTGENLLTFTNYSGYDPEVAGNRALLPGLDGLSYPRSRIFTFGLNVKF